MKNKNGFIATSILYSFFLIFVTLFLAIIADYLQDKVLLNSIEESIKNDINTTIGVNNGGSRFMPGQVLNIENLSSIENEVRSVKTNWVIAKIEGNVLTLYSTSLFWYLMEGWDSGAYYANTNHAVTFADLTNLASHYYNEAENAFDQAILLSTIYNFEDDEGVFTFTDGASGYRTHCVYQNNVNLCNDDTAIYSDKIPTINNRYCVRSCAAISKDKYRIKYEFNANRIYQRTNSPDGTITLQEV